MDHGEVISDGKSHEVFGGQTNKDLENFLVGIAKGAFSTSGLFTYKSGPGQGQLRPAFFFFIIKSHELLFVDSLLSIKT